MGLIRKSLSVSLWFISCFTSWKIRELHYTKRNQRIGVLWLWVQRKARQVFEFASKGLESTKHTIGRTAYTIVHLLLTYSTPHHHLLVYQALWSLVSLPLSWGQAGMGVPFSLPLQGQVRKEGIPLGHRSQGAGPWTQICKRLVVGTFLDKVLPFLQQNKHFQAGAEQTLWGACRISGDRSRGYVQGAYGCPPGGGGPSASSLQGLLMKTGGAVGSGAMEGGLL